MIDMGYNRAMTEVVRNNILNYELFSKATEGRDEKDRESKDSNPQPHREKERVRFEPETGSDLKKSRHRSPSPNLSLPQATKSKGLGKQNPTLRNPPHQTTVKFVLAVVVGSLRIIPPPRRIG